MLKSLPTLGLIVKEQSITKQNLYDTDAIFLTNAIYNIRWVADLNGHQFNIGPIAEIHRSLIQKLLK